MENQLQIFDHPDFGAIRTLVIDNEPWFVGKDVAVALEYSNPRDALAKHVDDEDKGVAKRDTLGGAQEMTIINESGLYSLILSSRLPAAKQFKHWVTREVLPSIRKTGTYSLTSRAGTDPFVLPTKPSSASEVAQLLRVLRNIMKDNFQPPHIIAEMAETVCTQFGIQLKENFVNRPLTAAEIEAKYPFSDWKPLAVRQETE